MQELLRLVTLWLVATFGLPEPVHPPRVVFVEQPRIAASFYGKPGVDRGGQIVAVYDAGTSTIMLRSDWDGSSIVDMSALVHEMVHHLQNSGKLRYACPEAREALAYKAQDAWLRMFGHTLKSAFGVDDFSLVFRTQCLPF